MRKSTIALTVALSLLASGVRAVPALAQDVPTVAVMDFSGFMMGGGGDASVNLGKAVTAMLVTEFSGREGLQVIERSQIQDLLREQDLCFSGRVEDCAAEVGKLLGAQYILHGQITSIVDNLRMDIRAVDVETSEIASVMKKSDRTSELLAVVVNLADEFGAQLDLVPPSDRAAVEQGPVAATIEFSRAVDFEDKGDVGQAIRHYEAALEIHPSHRGAQRALDRLRGGSDR